MQTRRLVSIVSTVLLLVPPMAPGKASAQVSTGVSAVAEVTGVEIPSQNAEDFLSDELAPSQNELTPVEITPVEIPDLRPTDEPVPTDDIVKPTGDSPVAGEGKEGEGESPLLEGEEEGPVFSPKPQRLTSMPDGSGQFSADLFTGSASYSYAFDLPEGRAGLTPPLALHYSSARRTELGTAGARGWDLEIGHIERVSKLGVDKLYANGASFVLYPPGGGGSVELVPLELADAIHGTYGAEVENDFSLITFATSNSWTVVDRGGTTWRYGTSAQSREYDPADEVRASSWYVTSAVGPTGATVGYEYTRYQNALYPSLIRYGGQMVGGFEEFGPFLATFGWHISEDAPLSYRTGYPITRDRYLEGIAVSVDGQERQWFIVSGGYLGSNGRGRMVTGIAEQRFDSNGTRYDLPPTTFTYEAVTSPTWEAFTDSSSTRTAFPVDIVSCYINLTNGPCDDNMVTLADLDGDGRQEVVRSQQAAMGSPDGYHVAEAVYRLEPNGVWSSTTSWDTAVPPIGSQYALPTGRMLLTDLDGDSRSDILISRSWDYHEGQPSPYDNRIYTNVGNGWVLSSSTTPINFNPEAYSRLFDINGDGLLDYVTSSAPWQYYQNYTPASSSAVYLNTGSGWELNASWTVPFAMTVCAPDGWGGCYANQEHSFEQSKYRFMDVNADGLTDVVYSWQLGEYAPVRAVFMNTGNGWQEQAAGQWGPFPDWIYCNPSYECGVDWWNRPSSGSDTLDADINGDGVGDFLYTFQSSGNVELRTGIRNSAHVSVQHNLPEFELALSDNYPRLNRYYPKYALGDLNGDGWLDLSWGYSRVNGNHYGNPSPSYDYRRYIRQGQPDYLLQTVTEPTGAVTTLEYTEAHQYYASSTPLNTTLPYAVWTPSRVTVAPGNGQPNQVTDYTYEGGAAAWASSTDREFAGFWKVTATSGDTKTITEFHQGLGGLPLTTSTQLHADRGQYMDEPAKRGRPYRTEVRNASTGALLSSEVTRWESASLAGAGRRFVYPIQSVSFVAKTNGQLDATAVERSYDVANGNELATYSYGSVVADAGTGELVDDLGSDYSMDEKQYASSSGSRILGAPKLAKVRDENDTVIAEKEIRYDGLPLGQVSQGKPTRVEDKLPSSAVYATYDSYANVAASSDPRGATTTFSYDSTYHLVPTASTNPLGQTSLQQVDLATRQVASSTDANGANERWIRDGFGRPLERWIQNPDAPGTVLAERWSYGDSARPVWVRHEAFDGVQDLDPSIDFTYADGAGRVIQTRALEATSTYIVSDTLYDSRGRVARQSLPYRGSGSSYATPASGVPSTTYAYDPAGRVTNVYAPAGNTSVAYDGLVTRVTDALGRVAEQERDGQERLVRVTRWLNSQPITYSYTWDAAGRLTDMQDPGGNTREFTYDGQGRLLTQTDWHATSSSPDVWAYAYDAAGNVSSSTDPRGATVHYTYDALNRPLTANDPSTAGTDTTYSYDHTGSYGVGRLHQAVHKDVGTTYGYDRLGRTTYVSRNIAGARFDQEYLYDLPGREVLRVEPNGYNVANEYDRMGRWSATSFTTGTIPESWTAATSSALEFTGNQYAEAAHSTSMNVSSGGLTIESWVRYGGVPTPGTALTILSKGNGQVGHGGNYLFQITENNTLILYRALYSYVESPALGDEGSGWHHYAVAFDGDLNTVRFYRDGQQLGGVYGLPDLIPNELPVRIGWTYDQNAAEDFNGSIAGVRLWNVARTATQIAGSFNRHTGGTGLVAYWCLDDGSGEQSEDCGPNGNTLQVANGGSTPSRIDQGPTILHKSGAIPASATALSYTPLGQLESVLYGNGLVTSDVYTPQDGYRLARRITGSPTPMFDPGYDIDVTSTASISSLRFVTIDHVGVPDTDGVYDLTGDFTLETWASTTGPSPYNESYTLIAKGYALPTGGNYQLYINEFNYLGLAYAKQGGWEARQVPGVLSDRQWHHYAVTYASSSQVLQFYRDGQPLGDQQQSSVQLTANNQPLRFGGTADSSSGNDYAGDLSEVRIWNVARSPGEIAATYNHRPSGTEAGLVGYWPFDERSGTTTADRVVPAHNATLGTGDMSPQWLATDPNFYERVHVPGVGDYLDYGNLIELKQDLSYTYDAVGNVTHLVDASVEPLGSDRTFAYDALDRLVGVQGTYAGSEDASSTFSYDSLGNMRTRGDANLYRLGYNSHPYRASHATIGGDGLMGFLWDDAGNLVEVGSNLYAYDGFGRLGTSTYWAGEEGYRDTYSYDHSGARALRTHDVVGDELDPSVTYYAGTYEEDDSGDARLFLDAPGRRLAQVSIPKSQPPALQYLHPDALGSSPLGTDQSGDLASAVDQDPYGLRRFEKLNGDLPLPTRSYTGKELDPSSWYYFGARYFSPEMARFTQVDPVTLGLARMRPAELSGLLSDPRRLHPYSYAGNNPMKYQDPDGEFFDIVLDIGFIAYDLYRIGSQIAAQGHVNKGEFLALGADIGGAIIPGATGLGMVARTAMHADDVAKAGKVAVKAAGEVTPDVLKALEHVEDARVTSHGSISGGHDVPKIVKRQDIQIKGLAIDPATEVPYFWAGAREEFKTGFRLGFTKQEKLQTVLTLKETAKKFELSPGWYTDYVGSDYNRFYVGGNQTVDTFMHAIPHYIPKPW